MECILTLLLLWVDLDAVDLDSPEWSSDINNVASVLKMWLRELPDPLMTFELHSGFIDAASTFLSLYSTFVTTIFGVGVVWCVASCGVSCRILCVASCVVFCSKLESGECEFWFLSLSFVSVLLVGLGAWGEGNLGGKGGVERTLVLTSTVPRYRSKDKKTTSLPPSFVLVAQDRAAYLVESARSALSRRGKWSRLRGTSSRYALSPLYLQTHASRE